MRRFVRGIRDEEFVVATNLAWKVFQRFEAAEYPEEGVRNFYSFLTDDILYKMFRIGEYRMFGCFEEKEAGGAGTMVGMSSLRDGNHISLLFVEERCHRQGIASALLKEMKRYLAEEAGEKTVTVNSSPYAVGFYHKRGFRDTAPQTLQNGILFTPMECIIKV